MPMIRPGFIFSVDRIELEACVRRQRGITVLPGEQMRSCCSMTGKAVLVSQNFSTWTTIPSGAVLPQILADVGFMDLARHSYPARAANCLNADGPGASNCC
jgi:hypothetical protein